MGHLVDLKLTEAESKKEFGDADTVAADRPKFPFGLTIHLDEASLKKLGMKESPKAGDELAIEAYVTVSQSGETEKAGGEIERNLTLQITDLAFTPRTEAKGRAADKLFGNK